MGAITSLLPPFFPLGFISSQEFFLIQVLPFPSCSFFFGICFLQALQFQLNLCWCLFSWEIQISRLGFVLFPLSRFSRTIPILPSSSSSSSRASSWWDWNIASDPGSWNPKSTDPTGSGADFTWSQFHLKNLGNFDLNQAGDPAGMPEHLECQNTWISCAVLDLEKLEDPRILG